MHFSQNDILFHLTGSNWMQKSGGIVCLIINKLLYVSHTPMTSTYSSYSHNIHLQLILPWHPPTAHTPMTSTYSSYSHDIHLQLLEEMVSLYCIELLVGRASRSEFDEGQMKSGKTEKNGCIWGWGIFFLHEYWIIISAWNDKYRKKYKKI